MTPEVISEFSTRVGGVPVVIPEAHISKCTNCGETSVGAKELKRWELIQKEQLRDAGQIPSAGEVTRIREAIGLSVSDFAKLLGVTRQTIHAWEREGCAALQLGPGALLLEVLAGERAGKTRGVLEFLARKAAQRGQEVDLSAVEKHGDARPSDPPLIFPRHKGNSFFACSKQAA
jgi:DNA-binding transcriptional regulator YiaG